MDPVDPDPQHCVEFNISVCRLGPHTVITFIFLEQMNKTYMRLVHGVEGGPGAL